MTEAHTRPETGSVLQLKVRLLGTGPMIWRRSRSGIHVAARTLRRARRGDGMGRNSSLSVQRPGVMHAGPYLCGQAVDLPLSDFRFRRNAKFSYVYDMRYWWSPVRKTTRTGSCEGSWCHVRTSLRAAEISEGTGPGADANLSVNLRHRKGIQCSSRDNLSVHQRNPHLMTPHRSIHA